MSNWYKIIKLSQRIIDNPRQYYDQVGHNDFDSDDPNYQSKEPNFIWLYHDGYIMAEEETEENPGHVEAFPDTRWGSVYSGRYETDSDTLTITKPLLGVAAYRNIPNMLMNKLYQKFPNTQRVLMY